MALSSAQVNHFKSSMNWLFKQQGAHYCSKKCDFLCLYKNPALTRLDLLCLSAVVLCCGDLTYTLIIGFHCQSVFKANQMAFSRSNILKWIELNWIGFELSLSESQTPVSDGIRRSNQEMTDLCLTMKLFATVLKHCALDYIQDNCGTAHNLKIEFCTSYISFIWTKFVPVLKVCQVCVSRLESLSI